MSGHPICSTPSYESPYVQMWCIKVHFGHLNSEAEILNQWSFILCYLLQFATIMTMMMTVIICFCHWRSNWIKQDKLWQISTHTFKYIFSWGMLVVQWSWMHSFMWHDVLTLYPRRGPLSFLSLSFAFVWSVCEDTLSPKSEVVHQWW